MNHVSLGKNANSLTVGTSGQECKDCACCIQLMAGADGCDRCRINGRPASPANAEGCRSFVREVGSDDEPGHWCAGSSSWKYDNESRN